REREVVRRRLETRAAELAAAGHPLQVVSEPGALPLFALVDGERLLLREREGALELKGRDCERFAAEDVVARFEAGEWLPSFSALSRPLAASTLYPVAATVLGPAELEVIEVVRRRRPRLVFAPLPNDRHPDHVRAGRLVADAAFYAGLRALETGLPPHRPQQVVYFPSTFLAEPTFLVDVTGTLEVKLAAVRAFRSQFFDPASKEPATFISSPEFLDGVAARARAFGRLANVGAAEGFVSPRPPLLADPLAAFDGFEKGC
ncbi:partial N-acetyl-alpha-D-glucosaminyl L-malate deacetylase 1, partial [Gammaproteobacteria bacterium]